MSNVKNEVVYPKFEASHYLNVHQSLKMKAETIGDLIKENEAIDDQERILEGGVVILGGVTIILDNKDDSGVEEGFNTMLMSIKLLNIARIEKLKKEIKLTIDELAKEEL